MRIFELHFNPRPKNEIAERIFDSFCYEPENIYEKRLGSLYMVGELQNLLPQNIHLLNSLSRIIKGKFYAAPLQTPERVFQDCLKAANEFLAGEVSKENVSWLGNLNFAVISLKSQNQRKAMFGNGFALNFTKVGAIKVLLLRGKQIVDISKNLDLEDIEPYPLKIFTNTVSGKLSFGDKIVMLTKEIYDFFSKYNLLNEFIKIESFDEKKIREILKPKEKEVSEISGVLLLIDTAVEPSGKPRMVTFKKELEKFSMKEVFSPLLKILLKLNSAAKVLVDKITFKLKNIFSLPKIKIGRKGGKQRTLSSLSLKQKIKISDNLKKNLILIFLLIVLLLAGFFIFQRQEKQKLAEGEKILNEVQEKMLKAENFLIFKDEKKANTLFEEALEKILPLTKEEGPLNDKAISLKESVETNLKKLSKLEVISNPKIIFEFDPKEFIPQKIVYLNENLYLFSPLSDKLFKINSQTKDRDSFSLPWGKDSEVNLAAISDNSIIFFSKPDKIVLFKNDGFAAPFSLKPPYPDFNFLSFFSYQGNLYFLDSERGEIIKYLYPLDRGKDSPQFYLNSETKKAIDSKSMAIDGSVWILREDNVISRYYNGQYQEDLNFDFFPSPKRLYKIFTLPYLPYLYLLEPTQNRVIVLEKTGEVVKQFQSEKFENLKDFAISANGKIIYLLSEQRVYQLEL